MKTIKITAPEGFKFEEYNGNEIELSLVAIKPEISFIVGKWNMVIGRHHDTIFNNLIFVTKIKDEWNNVECYGFGDHGQWCNDDRYYVNYQIEYIIETSPEYVKERLIEEAKKRYKIGDRVKLKVDAFYITEDNFKDIYVMNGDNNELIVDHKTYPGNLFASGQWAEILPPEKKYPTSVDEVEGRKWYISDTGKIEHISGTIGKQSVNTLSSSHRARAFLALMQLVELRDAWNKVDGFAPNWMNNGQGKHTISVHRNEINKSVNHGSQTVLYFDSSNTRDKFLETFRSLIEEAKELL